MDVEIQGAEVSGFRRYLKVPQEWQRESSSRRSQNQVFQIVALFIFVIVSIILFVHFLRNIRDGQVYWKTAITFSAVLAVGSAVMVLNSLPLATAGYETTNSYSAFLSNQFLMALIVGLGTGGGVLIMFGAGERFYRKDYPDRLHIPCLFTRRGYKSAEFFQATLMGYILAAFHIGFIVFFYVVGNRIGFWSPAHVEYDNTVSTFLPWIFPLVISLMASVTEEFWFRLWGISFFKRLFRSTWAAVILQAFLWGFLHSDYPQEPGFVRGIEVGLIGIAAGFVMVRFGIWATLTWHFVVDAILIGLFLFQSDNAYFWISGLVVCGGLAIPALVAGIYYLRRRSFEPVDDLLNGAMDKQLTQRLQRRRPAAIVEIPGLKEAPSYRALTTKVRRTVLIVGATLLLIAILPRPERFGDDISPHFDRKEAIEIARWAMKERYNVSVDSFKVGVLHSSDARLQSKMMQRLSYVKQHGTLRDAENIFLSPGGNEIFFWFIRFQCPLDPETYFVWVSQLDGSFGISHVLPDSASGAFLSPEDGKVLTERLFKAIEPNWQDYTLIKERDDTKENRRDHYFTWETIEPVVGEAHFRQIITLLGDEVQHIKRSMKIPEEWERHEQERGLRWTFLAILRAMLLLGGSVLAFTGLRKRFFTGSIRWRAGLITGLVVFVLAALNQWNEGTLYWWNYSSDIPARNYLITSLISMAVGTVFAALFAGVVITVAATLAGGLDRSHISPWKPYKSKRAFEDGILLVIGTLGVCFGLLWLFETVGIKYNMPLHNYTVPIPGSMGLYQPWFGMLLDALRNALVYSSLIMIAYVILTAGLKHYLLRALVLVLLAIAAADIIAPVPGNPTTGELIWSWGRSLVVVMLGYIVLRYFIGGRLWVMIVSWFIAAITVDSITLLKWGETPYQLQGWLLMVLALAPVVWMLVGVVRSKAV